MSLPRIWRKAKTPGKLGSIKGSRSILRTAVALNAQGARTNEAGRRAGQGPKAWGAPCNTQGGHEARL
eukprot:9850444-Alexandrium_andersonii.AAC.1